MLNELNLTWPRGISQLYYKQLERERKKRLRSIANGSKESVNETAGSNNRKLSRRLDRVGVREGDKKQIKRTKQ